MNNKTRSLRATSAVMLLVLVAFINVDALAHIRTGAEYRFDFALNVTLVGIALAVVLFAWNSIQYAVKRTK
jgi:hypothetical protein